METIATPPPQRDPEFAVARPEPGSRYEPDDLRPEQYLRVLANPFLALAGLAAWVLVVLQSSALLRRHGEPDVPLAPILALILLASLALLPRLVHYHCLDCGATGRLSLWRRHLCAPSTLRRRTGRPRRFRGPAPFVQILLWLWAVLFLCVLFDALGVRWLPPY